MEAERQWGRARENRPVEGGSYGRIGHCDANARVCSYVQELQAKECYSLDVALASADQR